MSKIFDAYANNLHLCADAFEGDDDKKLIAEVMKEGAERIDKLNIKIVFIPRQ